MLQSLAHVKIIKCLLLSTVLTTMLSSCAVFSGLFKGDENNTEDIEVLVLTTPTINPDTNDRPSPIRLDLFQLNETAEFTTTSYIELIDKDSDLDGELIDRTQFIIHPDEIKSLELSLSEETKYVGVAAGYQDIENSNWKLVLIRQPNKWGSRNNYLNLKIETYDIFQLSKKEMKNELKFYAETHPESDKVTKNGKYIKPKLNYSKGLFIAQ